MVVHDALAESDAATEWSPEDARRWWVSYRPDGPATTVNQSDVETIAVDLGGRQTFPLSNVLTRLNR